MRTGDISKMALEQKLSHKNVNNINTRNYIFNATLLRYLYLSKYEYKQLKLIFFSMFSSPSPSLCLNSKVNKQEIAAAVGGTKKLKLGCVWSRVEYPHFFLLPYYYYYYLKKSTETKQCFDIILFRKQFNSMFFMIIPYDDYGNTFFQIFADIFVARDIHCCQLGENSKRSFGFFLLLSKLIFLLNIKS